MKASFKRHFLKFLSGKTFIFLIKTLNVMNYAREIVFWSAFGMYRSVFVADSMAKFHDVFTCARKVEILYILRVQSVINQ
jgi:hypothetical protein